ncbi:MAG: putative Methylase involved in ubiquinone/menaquinone biosynthesis [Promethearchaeota archaeon]|nr:MAG: putative Methylase involved in ubiquinone/menaquinone biosynthesis [Candidatus Lokiarchaeota archaeon]
MEDYSFNVISDDWDRKRSKPWRTLEKFLSILKKEDHRFSGINLDLGCANGRNFRLFIDENSFLIGIDKAKSLLEKAREKLRNNDEFSHENSNRIALILADMNYLPIRNESIDNVFSIASLHHIRGYSTRKKVINEIYTLLKKSGYFLVTLWKRWQKRFKKYFLLDIFKRLCSEKYRQKQKERGLPEFGDKYVSWTLSKDKRTVKRFYHLFSRKEARELLDNFSIEQVKEMGGPTDNDNIFALVHKN